MWQAAVIAHKQMIQQHSFQNNSVSVEVKELDLALHV